MRVDTGEHRPITEKGIYRRVSIKIVKIQRSKLKGNTNFFAGQLSPNSDMDSIMPCAVKSSLETVLQISLEIHHIGPHINKSFLLTKK
jgi:hypothetical protein